MNKPVAVVDHRQQNGVTWLKIKKGRAVMPDHNTLLYTHPAKELHLSLQKSKETGELLAVTYTDDEHRIVEVLWKKPPAKTLTDEEIEEVIEMVGYPRTHAMDIYFARAILRKAQEK